MKGRYIVAATVKTAEDPIFPADVALFEADSRIDALRQANKFWPSPLVSGRYAGERRGLRVVDGPDDRPASSDHFVTVDK